MLVYLQRRGEGRNSSRGGRPQPRVADNGSHGAAHRWPEESDATVDRYKPSRRVGKKYIKKKHSAFDGKTCLNPLKTLSFGMLICVVYRPHRSRDAMKTNRRAPRCCSTFPELGQAAILPRNKGSWNTANMSLFDTGDERGLIPCH